MNSGCFRSQTPGQWSRHSSSGAAIVGMSGASLLTTTFTGIFITRATLCLFVAMGEWYCFIHHGGAGPTELPVFRAISFRWHGWRTRRDQWSRALITALWSASLASVVAQSINTVYSGLTNCFKCSKAESNLVLTTVHHGIARQYSNRAVYMQREFKSVLQLHHGFVWERLAALGWH